MKRVKIVLACLLATVVLSGCKSTEKNLEEKNLQDITIDSEKSEEKTKDTGGLSNEYITISAYKGIEVEDLAASEVTDEDVEQKITSILESNKILREIQNRSAQKGDIATIDFSGENNQFKWKEKNLQLQIGSGEFSESIETGIIGHQIGDEFSVKGVLPEYYEGSEGKEVSVHIKLERLQEAETPQLNDQFVQRISTKSKTVDEYKEEVRKILEEENGVTVNLEERAKIWKQVLDHTKVRKYPKERLEEERKIYLMQSGMSEDDFSAEIDLEEISKEKVKEYLTAELIAEAENLYPSDEKMKALEKEYISEYGFETLEEMEEMIGKGEVDKLILLEIVQNWVVDHCKITK